MSRCALPSAYPNNSEALPAAWLARHHAWTSSNTEPGAGQR
jgi:hypothetical protein